MTTSTARKMTIATLLTLLLASSALTVGSATVAPPTTPKNPSCSGLDDATLANNVRDELAKTMSARVMTNIQITAKNRVVTLKGSATYWGTRARAAELARKVACVRRVFNQIKVVPLTTECVGGQQNCCCPDDGCICSNVCPPCGNLKGPGPGRHRRGRRG